MAAALRKLHPLELNNLVKVALIAPPESYGNNTRSEEASEPYSF